MQDVAVAGRLRDYFPYELNRINYLVNCSEKYKFVYVETPKVACSTIKRVLQIIEAGGDRSKIAGKIHDRSQSPLLNPSNIGAGADELLSSDKYFRFSFVRNPYSRILSAYLDKLVVNQWERNRRLPELGFDRQSDVTLLQFLEKIRDIPNLNKDIHWTPQVYLLQIQNVHYHFIGRFENFAEGFRKVVMKVDPTADASLLTARSDQHKTNAGSRIAELVGSRERDLILEIFEDDFLFFGYSMDPHFGDA